MKDNWLDEILLPLNKLLDQLKEEANKWAKELEWQKEFEDEVECADDLFPIFDEYIGYQVKVKIKCKDGCIQIERIK